VARSGYPLRACKRCAPLRNERRSCDMSKRRLSRRFARTTPLTHAPNVRHLGCAPKPPAFRFLKVRRCVSKRREVRQESVLRTCVLGESARSVARSKGRASGCEAKARQSASGLRSALASALAGAQLGRAAGQQRADPAFPPALSPAPNLICS
jgi:hypothetical protein